MVDNVTLKLEEAFQDEAFTQKLFELDNPEDVQKAFAEKGLDFTIDEIKEIGKQLVSVNAGELNADDLDAVSGGSATVVITAVAACINLAIAIGKAFKAGW